MNPSPTEAQMKLFSRKGIENFQLCVSLIQFISSICEDECVIIIYHAINAQYNYVPVSRKKTSTSEEIIEYKAFSLQCNIIPSHNYFEYYIYQIFPYILNENELFVKLYKIKTVSNNSELIYWAHIQIP